MLREKSKRCESHACLLLRYVGPMVTRGFQHGHCSANGNAIRQKAYRQEDDQHPEVKSNREMIERAISALGTLSRILYFSSLPIRSKLSFVHGDH